MADGDLEMEFGSDDTKKLCASVVNGKRQTRRLARVARFSWHGARLNESKPSECRAHYPTAHHPNNSP